MIKNPNWFSNIVERLYIRNYGQNEVFSSLNDSHSVFKNAVLFADVYQNDHYESLKLNNLKNLYAKYIEFN
jgi:hypothetical protein